MQASTVVLVQKHQDLTFKLVMASLVLCASPVRSALVDHLKKLLVQKGDFVKTMLALSLLDSVKQVTIVLKDPSLRMNLFANQAIIVLLEANP